MKDILWNKVNEVLLTTCINSIWYSNISFGHIITSILFSHHQLWRRYLLRKKKTVQIMCKLYSIYVLKTYTNSFSFFLINSQLNSTEWRMIMLIGVSHHPTPQQIRGVAWYDRAKKIWAKQKWDKGTPPIKKIPTNSIQFTALFAQA